MISLSDLHPMPTSRTTHPGPLRHSDALRTQIEAIENCATCPRLRTHCLNIAKTKKKAYLGDTYWGKPIAGFGDERAQVWIVGLAPAAHGANRTGRVFTGDRSGEWLYKVLHQVGFSNLPVSTWANDELRLNGAYISCVVRCAPPDNKPTREEVAACFPYLETDLTLLSEVETIVALGSLAWDNVLKLFPKPIKPVKFGHGARCELTRDGRPYLLIGSYHPSQQNTFTKRLTWPMWEGIFSGLKPRR